MSDYNSQVGQDKFALNILKNKNDGTFLEIGSNHPVQLNNTFIMENKYNWRGIMVEKDKNFLPLYREYRKKSVYEINDACKIDYSKILEENSFPNHIDYLQIDLHVNNNSTLNCLKLLDNTIFDKYKFATVTFEHDIYANNNVTRMESRRIFENKGYHLVFEDISDGKNPFEDWWVCPSLVDMGYVKKIQELNKNKYVIGKKGIKCLEGKNIIYP